MKYVINCGGQYDKWPVPKQLTPINGEPLVARTIRLLRENGVEDIAICSNQDGFEGFGVPVLKHENEYRLGLDNAYGHWLNGFMYFEEPTCYLFGDVIFSPDAIKTIVEYDDEDIMFFASAEPLPKGYPKQWAEPFAFKVKDMESFFNAIDRAKFYDQEGCFYRMAVSWELWQVIKHTPLNRINYNNYVAINDYTCDIDTPEDAKFYESLEGRILKTWG